jgi:phytoene desaturase
LIKEGEEIMEKIIIIGAGIAGLTAGIYARQSGFETEIVEMHTISGGECTGWKRGGYYIDGCIHWLMGSKTGTPLNRVWREVGALDDSVAIINQEEFTRLEMDGRAAIIYRSLDKTEKHLKELSPADADAIAQLCADARKFKNMQMPVDGPIDMMSPLTGMKLGMKMLPLMGLMKKYSKMSMTQLAVQFQDPLIRTLISRMMPEPYCAMPLMMTLGSLDNGDSGFPQGGSVPLVQRMEKRYLSLGGKVFYRSPVQKILVENGRATGIQLADGSKRQADWVISAADGYATLYHMLEGKYTSDAIKEKYEDHHKYPVYTTVQVALGINADLTGQPYALTVPAESPLDAGGITHNFIGFKNYCFDSTLQPAGKSVVISILDADFDWWKAKKEDSAAYRSEKERIASAVCAAIERRFPEARGKIEQVDVATPMTYVRYCNAWRGSWMSFMTTPETDRAKNDLPGNLPGLDRFYMAGQWTMPPGGLPGAVMAGRFAVQRICTQSKVKFSAR